MTIQINSDGDLIPANDIFKEIVEEMLEKDKRFKGMAKYVSNIVFFWSNQIPTACAGHGFIFFNKDFWKSLLPEQRKTVVAHEIWHLILEHLERGEKKEPTAYNIAGDHVINLTLQEDGFPISDKSDYGGTTPLCDPAYKGMSTEKIYNIVYQDMKDNPGKHSSPQGTPSRDQIKDLIEQALQGSGKDLEQQKQEDKNLLDEAKSGCGSEDSNTDRIIELDRDRKQVQKKTYEEIFADYLVDPLSGGKRTFMRPSRRQISGGLRMKGKYPKKGRKNRLTHLVYALDVSGSITNDQARLFLTSAKDLKDKLNPALMTIMLWDTRIVLEKVFSEHESIKGINIYAGGGTDLHPVYKRVEQINPEALVIFTDLCVAIPPKPKWDTIWFVPDENMHEYFLEPVTYGEVFSIPKG